MVANIELPTEYRLNADDFITQKVFQLLPNKGMVLCYVSTPREPSTATILSELAMQGRLAVPRCDVLGEISIIPIADTTLLQPGRYGIFEPPKNLPKVSVEEVGTIIMPCVACDREMNRVGHGGGYYDRLLCDTKCKCICLCYSKTLLLQLPTEPHDIKPSCIVTENEVLWATDTVI